MLVTGRFPESLETAAVALTDLTQDPHSRTVVQCHAGVVDVDPAQLLLADARAAGDLVPHDVRHVDTPHVFSAEI